MINDMLYCLIKDLLHLANSRQADQKDQDRKHKINKA